MDTFKKVAKIACIVIAVAAAICGIAVAIKQIKAKKELQADSEENYVSCSCCEIPENM